MTWQAAKGLILLAPLLLLGACGDARGREDAVERDLYRTATTAPSAIEFGVDRCAYCDQVIVDVRFGAELQTRDGTVYKFMSTECMAGFLLEGRVAREEIAGMWVVDFSHGNRLIDVKEAHFVRSQSRPSPNGLNIIPVRDQLRAVNLHFAYGGEIIDFDRVLAVVAEAWNPAG
jgi:copper chaperone NosL